MFGAYGTVCGKHSHIIICGEKVDRMVCGKKKIV